MFVEFPYALHYAVYAHENYFHSSTEEMEHIKKWMLA